MTMWDDEWNDTSDEWNDTSKLNT